MTSAPTNTHELLERLRRDRIERLWVIYHDYSGVGAAKSVPPEQFESVVEHGSVFALTNLEMDVRDFQPESAVNLADSGDFLATPDPRSYAPVPRFPGTARTHSWMRATDESSWQGCPRTRLERIIDKIDAEGLSIRSALEPEFYLVTRTAEGEYIPANSTTMFSVAGLRRANPFVTELMDELHGMGISIAQMGKEYGPGQYELSVEHNDPVGAVDDYWTVKDAVHDIARQNDCVATFMPKPYSEWAGCSLHVHLSLWTADGAQDVTASERDNTSLSEVGSWFLGGLLAHSAALTALGSPTVNSYKRLLPGSWAPAHAYWGLGNRSAVARVPGVGKRRRIEYRSGDNTCNPALYMTGLLAAGLDGIRKKTDPGPSLNADAAHLTPEEFAGAGLSYLPRRLPEALTALETDDVICDALGAEIVRTLLSVKRSELETYDLHVHPWERETYLEVI